MSRFLISMERVAIDTLSVIVNDADPRIAAWLAEPEEERNPHDLLSIVDDGAAQVESDDVVGLYVDGIEELPPCSS
jgi:hypothetical protein